MNYQSQQEIIRLLKHQLLSTQIKSISFLIIGLTSLVGVPLISKGFSLRDKIINSTGFIVGLSSLSFCLVINPKLKELEGKNRMIKELEKNLFIDEQILTYQNLRIPYQLPSTQLQNTEVTKVTPVTSNGGNLEIPMVTEVTEVLPVTVTNEVISEIIQLLSEGKSDTFIIKNILKCEGRNFSKGKEILENIKSELK